jgi:hypothetical protein
LELGLEASKAFEAIEERDECFVESRNPQDVANTS